jgi:hypothetical protein
MILFYYWSFEIDFSHLITRNVVYCNGDDDVTTQ